MTYKKLGVKEDVIISNYTSSTKHHKQKSIGKRVVYKGSDNNYYIYYKGKYRRISKSLYSSKITAYANDNEF